MSTPQTLTLQLHIDGAWRDAMLVEFFEPDLGVEGRCRAGYLDSYVVEHIEHLHSVGDHAVSVRWPVDFRSEPLACWPAFLLDLMPGAAVRRFWARRLNLPAGHPRRHDLTMLERCGASPIGHTRIKEATRWLKGAERRAFCEADVVQRDVDFLTFAAEAGAAVGGATGVGGDAPKLLLAEDHDGGLHPEGVLDDAEVAQHWFVKFTRHDNALADQHVLAAEHVYHRVLLQMGLSSLERVEWRDPPTGRASLWLSRFDRRVTPDGVQRLPVESLYSVVGSTQPGATIAHTTYLAALTTLWSEHGQRDAVPDLIADYVCRDLLNVVLGNSDNHGRNTAILRHGGQLSLAPIYDLAPMVMDPDGITRTSRWPAPAARGGRIDWLQVCELFSEQVPSRDWLLERLKAFAASLTAMPALMREQGLPHDVMTFPRLHLHKLPETLDRWGLLP